MPKLVTYFFIIIGAQLLISCSNKSLHQDPTLYHSIGGLENIERLVNAFTHRIAQDQDILPYFSKSNVSHFKRGFISHLCDAIGGPCQYQGDTMIDIHTGMNISEKHFTRIVELLIHAMEDVDISYQNQNKILNILAPSRVDIIKI